MRAIPNAAEGHLVCHCSHCMWRAGDMVFCWHCGGHAQKRCSKLLRGVCRGPGRVVSTPLRRLRSGLHPISGVRLGDVVRHW